MGDIFSQFQDLFSEFFAGGGGPQRGRRQGPRRGADLRIQEQLTLKDAVVGCKKEVIGTCARSSASSCGGSGAAPGSQRQACGTCRGRRPGLERARLRMFTSTCPTCHGQGSTFRNPCPKCHGAGQVEKTRKVLVTFPAGIDGTSGFVYLVKVFPAQPAAKRAISYVDVELEPDERFERDGIDLITRASVSFADAALGTTITLAAARRHRARGRPPCRAPSPATSSPSRARAPRASTAAAEARCTFRSRSKYRARCRRGPKRCSPSSNKS